MKQNNRNNVSGRNSVIGQFGAQKKKTITALCLVGLMVLMWVRVLGKRTPQDAKASLMAQVADLNSEGANSQVKISFVELPKVKSRNDVLTRDFFAANGWRGFLREGLIGVKEVNVSENDNEKLVRQIAEKLKLEAIGLGENPQAFINNKPLSVGDKLLVRDGIGTYECEVVEIEEDIVFVKFGKAEIQLRLKRKAEETVGR